jgi:hypothetical protein
MPTAGQFFPAGKGCSAGTQDGGLGLPLKTVQVRMGQSTLAMTADTYGQLFPSQDDAEVLAAGERGADGGAPVIRSPARPGLLAGARGLTHRPKLGNQRLATTGSRDCPLDCEVTKLRLDQPYEAVGIG